MFQMPIMNVSTKRIPDQKNTDIEYKHQFNEIILKQIFSYLNVQNLLSASQVCTTWNKIAKDKLLWKNVRLKNILIRNWDKFIEDIINKLGTMSLDTRDMIIPTEIEDNEKFWIQFLLSLKKVNNLKHIFLYNCPPHVVEYTIFTMLQLEVLEASSIKIQEYYANELITFNLDFLSQMSNLTVLKLRGLSKIKFKKLPSFKHLINLNTLSLTSNKPFDNAMWKTLETVNTGLKHLEFGDCKYLSNDFAVLLKRFINLISMRLENFQGISINVTRNVFESIRNLHKLTTLELINIIISTSVKTELEKCDNIKTLLIIPCYGTGLGSHHINIVDLLIKSFKILSNTLTEVVWVFTFEYLRIIDIFIFYSSQSHHIFGRRGINDSNSMNHILIKKSIQQYENEITIENGSLLDNINMYIISTETLSKLLGMYMPNTKTTLFKIPFSKTTEFHLEFK